VPGSISSLRGLVVAVVNWILMEDAD